MGGHEGNEGAAQVLEAQDAVLGVFALASRPKREGLVEKPRLQTLTTREQGQRVG